MIGLPFVASWDPSSSEDVLELHVVSKTNNHMNLWPGLRSKLIVPSPLHVEGGAPWLGGPWLGVAPVGLPVLG